MSSAQFSKLSDATPSCPIICFLAADSWLSFIKFSLSFFSSFLASSMHRSLSSGSQPKYMLNTPVSVYDVRFDSTLYTNAFFSLRAIFRRLFIPGPPRILFSRYRPVLLLSCASYALVPIMTCDWCVSLFIVISRGT